MSDPSHRSDPRVLQANERTLLAWLRTGIGLMAFGFVVARAGEWVGMLTGQEPAGVGVLPWLGVGLIVLGAVATALAGFSYLRIRATLLAGREVEVGAYLAPTVTMLVTIIGLVLAALLAVDSLTGR